MRVFHATYRDFDQFEPGGYDPMLSGRAIWFSGRPDRLNMAHQNWIAEKDLGAQLVDEETAMRTGYRVIPAYVRMENPKEWSHRSHMIHLLTPKDIARLKRQGYDGAIKRNRDGSIDELVVFDGSQVKSAFNRKPTKEEHLMKFEQVLKYDPRQPRDPSGVPTGGQWAARYSGKQGDWMREHKAKQKEFAKSNPKGLRYDAELTGERLPSEALVGYLKAFAQFQKQNAQQHGLRYGGSEDFVMGEGREFDVPEAPPAIKLGTPKECFSNAVDFIMQKDGLSEKGRYRYVEGYVMSPKLPMAIHHAWVEDTQTGLAIDPTLGWNPKARYYGVSFEPAYLRKKLVEHGYYGLFTGDVMVHDLVLGKDADYKYREQP